jgi:hypothetical protein
MNPSGIHEARPTVPPGRAGPDDLVHGPLVIGREHRPEDGKRRVE